MNQRLPIYEPRLLILWTNTTNGQNKLYRRWTNQSENLVVSYCRYCLHICQWLPNWVALCQDVFRNLFHLWKDRSPLYFKSIESTLWTISIAWKTSTQKPFILFPSPKSFDLNILYMGSDRSNFSTYLLYGRGGSLERFVFQGCHQRFTSEKGCSRECRDNQKVVRLVYQSATKRITAGKGRRETKEIGNHWIYRYAINKVYIWSLSELIKLSILTQSKSNLRVSINTQLVSEICK